MDEYTLLEAKVNGTLKKESCGEIYIDVEINRDSVKFVGIKPSKSQLAYYKPISNNEAGLPEDELICNKIIFYNNLPFKLKKGDLIRAYMNRKYMAVADKIEKIETK